MMFETIAAARVFVVWILFSTAAVFVLSWSAPSEPERPVATFRGPRVEIGSRTPVRLPQARLRPASR